MFQNPGCRPQCPWWSWGWSCRASCQFTSAPEQGCSFLPPLWLSEAVQLVLEKLLSTEQTGASLGHSYSLRV